MRFTPDAAAALRQAISLAGGVEVFGICDVEDGQVVAVEVHARGTADAVPALLTRPRAGQAVVHNHPSGDLRPSEADLSLAHRYGEDGVGVVIVDSKVTRDNWIVEPHAQVGAPVDPAEIEHLFRVALPQQYPGWEARDAQVELALRVAHGLSEGVPIACEAGTGTGKSLAYLVPSAVWARDNQQKVVVSTYTRALQIQLVRSDLPVLRKLGLDVKTSVLQGRNNYVCKRRLASALEETGLADEEKDLLRALAEWEQHSIDGARTDLPFPVGADIWDRVGSDSDQTLSVRCPHYSACRYYTARRDAAAAGIVVVNHALLLIDRVLTAEVGRGVLPRYTRVVLDEAHHLEQAATGAISGRVTRRGIARAVSPLLQRKGRAGALNRFLEEMCTDGAPVPPEDQPALAQTVRAAQPRVEGWTRQARTAIEQLGLDVLGPGQHGPRRFVATDEETPLWIEVVEPQVAALATALERAAAELDQVLEPIEELAIPSSRMQPVLDVRRARNRLQTLAGRARGFLESSEYTCRWLEPDPDRRSGVPSATVVTAPIEVGPVLKRILWDPVAGTQGLSATLTVRGSFHHWQHRVGSGELETSVFPSPFDFASQALLGLPRDLPDPNDPAWDQAVVRTVLDAVSVSDGGAFVLCTSHRAVASISAALHARMGRDRPILSQTRAGRAQLVRRFKANPRSVLVGTDSFWEGVDVKGDGLRLVIIPRLPFRVPSDPLEQARHELLRNRGLDPFRAYTLPSAVLKLRQGFGRLVRSADDRGAVLILDPRLHRRNYGRVVLASLPPARRVTGDWRQVHEALTAFYATRTAR